MLAQYPIAGAPIGGMFRTVAALPPPSNGQTSQLTLPAARTAVFAGRTRVVSFGGEGSSQAALRAARFLEKGLADVLYIVADCTKDLTESGGATITGATIIPAGVTLLDGPSIQGPLVVAKLGGFNTALADNLATFRLKYANGEQVDHTIHFRLLDDRTGTFDKDPDDQRFYALDLTADVALGKAAPQSVATPVTAGVQVLSTPAIQGNLVVVMIGGLDTAGGPNTCTIAVTLANTEVIVRTLYFNKVDN